MVDHRRWLTDEVRRELDGCGFPWELRPGKGDHLKVFIAGRMASVIGRNMRSAGGHHRKDNVVHDVRRMVRTLREGLTPV